MERVRCVNVFACLLLGLVITACVPPQPGISVKIIPTSKDCVVVRNELVELLSRWEHELIYAPDPRYSGNAYKSTFEGNWSDFGGKNRSGAVASLGDYPELGVGIGYDTRDCELRVGLGYSKLVLDPKKKFGEMEKKYAYELFSLLKEHYGDSRIKDVHMEGF